MPGQLALPWAARREEATVPKRLNPEAAFARVFRRLGLGPTPPQFRVEYRPFAGLRSTIRVRGRSRLRHHVMPNQPASASNALAIPTIASNARCTTLAGGRSRGGTLRSPVIFVSVL